MSQIWERIIAWFAANVPAKRYSFNAGATEEDLLAAEKRMGVRLPDDVRVSWLLHDGMEEGAFFENYELMSLERIIRQWRRSEGAVEAIELGISQAIRAEPEGPIKPVCWNVLWIPIMDADGDGVLIDFDPAPVGTVGQIIRRCHEVGPLCVLANSFGEFMGRYAHDLESSKYRFDQSWCISLKNT